MAKRCVRDQMLLSTAYRKSYYEKSIVGLTFKFIQIFGQNFVFFTERCQSCRGCLIAYKASKFTLFSVSGLKKVD